MKVLDTTFLIDLFKGKPETLSKQKEEDFFVTSQINMYEILVGIFHDGNSSKILKVQELFENIRVLPLTESGVMKSAQISAELMKEGLMVEDMDCLTAGIALSHGINTVITKNVKHFKRMKGIIVETY